MNHLLLISGEDIPFVEAQISIHQPRIKEISLIGEDNFFAGCQFLNLSKDDLKVEDKRVLENKSDFEIFMSIMCSKEKMEYKNSVMMLLALMFPNYTINFTPREILLVNKKHSTRINETNFDIFKDIINSMFGVNEFGSVDGKYNPSDQKAKKLVEKITKYKEKIAKIKNGSDVKEIDVFGRYISILAIGLQMDINILKNYTVYQLKNQFNRFQMKEAFEQYKDSKLAGATGLEDVDYWMNDIHS